MNAHHIAMANEKLKSLQGQLAYANDKLQSGQLQAWESKEWSKVADQLTADVRNAEKHLKTVEAL